MSFDSWVFFLLLAGVIALHRLLPWRAGRLALLAASYLFYGAAVPWHCVLLLLSTAVDFGAALGIHAAKTARGRRLLVALSLAANLGLLLAFKYGAMLSMTANAALGWVGAPLLPVPDWVLPVGISFYTFQTLSYTLDVYYEKVRPTRDIVEFALFVAFFPQLVAGPIERASRLLPQLGARRLPDAAAMEAGFQRVLVGLAKKTVLADRLGVFVDGVFDSPAQASAPTMLAATACFAMQVYLDFSGYCDIAIGAARMLGVELRENFRWPVLARNPVDLWSRWHITLTTWFRDYVLSTLIGRRRPGVVRRLANLVLVMTLVGLWHGPGWNFVLFGVAAGLGVAAYEGVYLFSGRSRSRPLFGRSPLAHVAAVLATALYCLFLALLFRAHCATAALEALGALAGGDLSVDVETAVFGAAALLLWAAAVSLGALRERRVALPSLPAPARALLWTALIVAILYGGIETGEQFVYFRF